MYWKNSYRQIKQNILGQPDILFFINLIRDVHMAFAITFRRKMTPHRKHSEHVGRKEFE